MHMGIAVEEELNHMHMGTTVEEGLHHMGIAGMDKGQKGHSPLCRRAAGQGEGHSPLCRRAVGKGTPAGAIAFPSHRSQSPAYPAGGQKGASI
ncbi:hypothetical protein SUGI_0268670 [Cryptomeria japonica]|nr:hypothetical protein SUGI_0268670 [Cryptomeria japonica]